MLLADGINLPIVAALGLAVFGPLTLLVTTIESLAFKYVSKVGFRAVFRRVLLANVVSTLAGGIVLAFQDSLVRATGIMASIPAFVPGYRWVALLLIGVYFGKSVIVEGLVLLARHFAQRLERSRRNVLRSVAVGNVLSYCVVGPLFFYATRPTFGRVETTTDTAWTANADQLVYYIDREDRFIKRIRLDGTGQTTVVPYPADDFLVAGNAQAFVYRGTDAKLYVYRAGDAEPVIGAETEQRHLMAAASLAPDLRRLAFMERYNQEGTGEPYYALKLAELDTGTVVFLPHRVGGYSSPHLCWSRDGETIYVDRSDGDITAIAAEAPHGHRLISAENPPAPQELAESYRGAGGRFAFRGWGSYWQEDQVGEYRVRVYPYLGSRVLIQRNGSTEWQVMNEYGLMPLGRPAPGYPSFLPNGTEVLLEWWNQLYILDIEHRRLGLVTDGATYVMLTPRFRVRFGPLCDY